MRLLLQTFVIEHYLTQSSECEQSARSQVGVSEAVILKFLDNGLAAEAGLPIRPSSPSPPTTPVSSPPSSSLSGSFLATRRRFSSFQKPTGHDAHEDGSLMQLTRADSQCCLADICVIKGMYQVLDGRDIKGAYYLRKAWTIYSQLWHDITSIRPHDEPSNPQRRPVEHVRFDRAAQEYLLSWDSVRSSVSCGIGLFNILLSILGESFSVSFRNIGVNANVGAGLGLMNEAVHGNSFRAPVAAVLLIQHYVSHGRSMSLATNRLSSIGGSSKVQESSLVDMRAYLERRFPSGPVVQHMLAQLDRSHGNWSQQVPVTAALAHQHPGFQLLRIEYAVSLVIEGNWAGAADILSRLWRQSHQPQPSAASTHTESIGFVDTWLLVGILLCGCLSITELLQDSPNDRGSDHEGSLERPSLAVASRLSEQSRALQGTHRSLNNTPGRSYRLQCLQHLLQITRQIENEAKIRTVSPLWLFLTLYLRRDLEYACSDPSRSPATQALYAAVSRLSTKARDAASSSGSLEFVAMHEIIWSLVRGAIAKYSILPFTIAQMALDPIVNASSPAIQSGISPAQADKPSAQIGGRSPVLTGRPPTQIQQTLQREAVEYLSKCAERQTLPTRTAAKPDPLVTMAALFAEFELGEYLCLMGQRANGVLRLRACLNSRLVSKDTPLIVLHRSGLPECVIHDLRQRCEQAIAKHSEPHTLPTTDTAARPHGHRPS
ncbi:uncharacterized protein BJ171DRAFT_148382 [Polychytrium aggregatum]|uniref:uncharacterized protein n=1 Tax=Polychytrium aggregatum TaxID=110093 RepID=UPI0022FE14D5|nr:uncharacterized protein BJ171DRAFT_148382 [Polychytrium aggregatum]KAI9203247.1 hypothetical protein BJ171DRAFT_148382 [Polychytrium aggregatum]